jgi:hypothetical protein
MRPMVAMAAPLLLPCPIMYWYWRSRPHAAANLLPPLGPLTLVCCSAAILMNFPGTKRDETRYYVFDCLSVGQGR